MKRMLMSKTAALMIAWSAAIISVSAQSSEKPGSDPRKVIEQFCKMDLAGRLLTHEGVEETAKLLVTPYRWSQNQEIVVVNNYVVRGPSKQSRRASITVDYRVWGEISPSLRFVRQEGVIADSPVMIHEYMDSVLTNRYNEVGESGPKAVVKGPLAWRIEITPSRPHVSVDTAIRYVAEMRGKSNDPTIKENADKTIVALRGLPIGTAEPQSTNLRKTPAAVLAQFCKMDMDGRQLTSNGWQEIASLFVQPGSPQREQIIVVKDCAASNASISEENKAEIVVEYLYLGQLDSNSAIFQQGSISNTKVLVNFSLVRTDADVLPEGKKGTDDTKEAPAWKIAGPLPNPHIDVAAALRYLSEIRDKTTDPNIKRNADQALRRLLGLH